MKMKIITQTDQLDKYLNKISKIFQFKDVLHQDITSDTIQSYYEQSNYGYSYFHSSKGCVHMALNSNGVFNEKGYFQQADLISKVIKRNNYNKVLELGCGKGFNSIHIARNCKQCDVRGIDITEAHLKIAINKSTHLNNATFALGDFHSLNFKDKYFDIVFEVESICHSFKIENVFQEVSRVLKPKGRFIIFDGFRTQDFSKQPKNIKLAAQLVEASMALKNGYQIDFVLNAAKKAGLKIESVDNISDEIMPNLGEFQKLARKYYKFPKIARTFLRILPKKLVMNSIAGLLMPFTIHAGAQGYYRIIFYKE